MRYTRSLGIAAASFALGGCASHNAKPTEAPEGYPSAVATNSCAPTDGPAVVLYLSGAATTAIPPAAPYVRVAIWRAAGSLVGQTVEWSGASALGAAELCDAGGSCETATAVRVRVDRRDDDGSLAGDLTVRAAGATVSGAFDAAWVESTMLCG